MSSVCLRALQWLSAMQGSPVSADQLAAACCCDRLDLLTALRGMVDDGLVRTTGSGESRLYRWTGDCE